MTCNQNCNQGRNCTCAPKVNQEWLKSLEMSGISPNTIKFAINAYIQGYTDAIKDKKC